MSPPRALATMYWASADILALAARLSSASDLPAADVLARRITALLDQMEKKCADGGVSRADIDDAKYAVVAFVDEQIFRSPWKGRQQWMLEPLQFSIYGENTAGEGFFTRMEGLENDATRAHVLEVYYLCLALGFEGKYAVKGPAALGAVIESVGQKLARSLPDTETVSPHGLPPDARTRGGRDLPVVGLAMATLLVAVIAYAGLRLATSAHASEAKTVMDRTTAVVLSPKKGL